MIRRRRLRYAAFTLIELLVVIAIIGVLVSLLLPAVQKVREAANRAQCSNNLKQLGTALMNYQSTSNCFPPGHTRIAANKGFGWIAQILPYIEQDNLHRLYKFNDDFSVNDGVPPTGVNGSRISLLRCPSAPSKRNESTRFFTDYSAVNVQYATGDLLDPNYWNPSTQTGLQHVQQSFNNSGVLYTTPVGGDLSGNTISDIRDGASNTIMVAEDAGRNFLFLSGTQVVPGNFGGPGGAWANPGNMIIAKGSSATALQKGGQGAFCAVNCLNKEEIYAFHPGTANAVFADGSVRSLRSNMNLFVLHALITKAAGEVNNSSDF